MKILSILPCFTLDLLCIKDILGTPKIIFAVTPNSHLVPTNNSDRNTVTEYQYNSLCSCD